jgi:thiamine biosynthesis protein ThiI
LEECISKEEIFDIIYKKTAEIHLDNIRWKSFVVRVKRSWIHSFNSTEIERYVWGGLLKFWEKCNVDLHNPEIKVNIEIKDKKFHVIKKSLKWMDWYPIWFQDKVVSLISGGFDSGVATHSMMKRWCKVDYLFFNLWGSAHELWVKQVSNYLWKNFSIPHKKARFITVNFEWVIEQLLVKVNHRFRGILLKRFMLRVASMVAENNYYALIKWDSLGQVSSQTLKNMHVIDKASDCLVLRPLISDNKQEIINISREIWTYHFACNMPEYCGVISDKPATWASLEDILEEEKNIEDSVLVEAYMNRKMEFVKDMLETDFNKKTEINTVYEIWENEILIDIREEKNKKLNEKNILEIPFFKINSEFPKLDQTKTYLFYCDKWVLSELHWLYLKENWFENIKIFRTDKPNISTCEK